MNQNVIDCIIDSVDPDYIPGKDDVISKYISSGCFSNVTCKEKGKSYTLNFPDRNTYTAKVHIDGGVIKDDSRRCDYCILTEDGIAVLVELKGNKIDEAYEQLTHTAQYLANAKFKNRFHHVYGRIVSSCCPNLASANKIECMETFKRLKGNVVSREVRFKEKYACLKK